MRSPSRASIPQNSGDSECTMPDSNQSDEYAPAAIVFKLPRWTSMHSEEDVHRPLVSRLNESSGAGR